MNRCSRELEKELSSYMLISKHNHESIIESVIEGLSDVRSCHDYEDIINVNEKRKSIDRYNYMKFDRFNLYITPSFLTHFDICNIGDL